MPPWGASGVRPNQRNSELLNAGNGREPRENPVVKLVGIVKSRPWKWATFSKELGALYLVHVKFWGSNRGAGTSCECVVDLTPLRTAVIGRGCQPQFEVVRQVDGDQRGI